MKRYYDKMEERHDKKQYLVGGALEIKDLFRDGYKARIRSTGVGEQRLVRGESLPNVRLACGTILQILTQILVRALPLSEWENAAMDGKNGTQKRFKTVKLMPK